MSDAGSRLAAASVAALVMGTLAAPTIASATPGAEAFLGSVEAGSFHTCGLNADGRAWCWGRDDFGQLGNGPGTAAQYTPVRVLGDRTFTAISAGATHTCALDTAGRAWCWGSDTYGALGDGDEAVDGPEHSPVPVAGDRNYRNITAGNDHTCAIDTAGKAWCWGYAEYGQVGDGPGTLPRFAPSAVAGGRTYRAVSAGSEFTCAVDTAGKPWCWGSDTNGKLGDGAELMPGDEFEPVAVSGDRVYAAVSAGVGHACALDTTGRAWCWGDDQVGQIGDGEEVINAYEAAPVPVWGDRAHVAVTAGSYHTCAVDTDGEPWCWGGDGHHQLADDPVKADRFLPVRVVGGHTCADITAGLNQTCAVATDGTVRCWGEDTYGRVGDGDDGQSDQPDPVPVAFPWPAAPSALTAIPGPAEVALSWGTPTDNGGSPILGYRIEQRSATGRWSITMDTTGSSATTHTVGGASPGTGYSFRVAAVTASGIGVRSLPSSFVTALPVTPLPPPRTKVKARAISDKGKFKVTVGPDLGAEAQWRFTVGVKKSGTWRALRRNGAVKVWSTRGPAHTRVLNLPAGKYRATSQRRYGYLGDTSRTVQLRR